MSVQGTKERETTCTKTGSTFVTMTQITAVQQMAASCSGAFLTSVLVTPFDVVKIRMQAAASVKGIQCPTCLFYFNGLMDHLCPQSAKPFAPAPCYKLINGNNNSLRALARIVQNEGLLALWSGLPPTLLMAIPSTVVYFTTYDNLKALLGYAPPPPGVIDTRLLVPMAAGGLARFASVSAISPLELIRTKMQSQLLSYGQVGTAIRDALRQGGLRSLWAGWTPTVLRDVPFSAVYFCGFEAFKIYYGNLFEITPSSSLSSMAKVNFCAGATSALIASILTQPFDVLKTQRQIKLGEANFGRIAPESTLQAASTLFRARGISSLYAGLTPRLLKVMPACAIMITSYEYFKEVFAARNKLKGQ